MRCVCLLAPLLAACVADLGSDGSGLARTVVRPDVTGAPPLVTTEARSDGEPDDCGAPLHLYDQAGLGGNELVLCAGPTSVEYDLRAITVPGSDGTTWWRAARSYAASCHGRFEMTPGAGEAAWGAVFDPGAVEHVMDIRFTPYVAVYPLAP